jgi:hypothetical protein
MRRNLYARILVLLMVVLSLLTPLGGMTRVMAQSGGLEGDNAYVSPQFGYTVRWGDDWRARSRDVISNPGGYDTLTLRGEDSTLWIQGQGDTVSAADAVLRRISIEGKDEDVVTQNLEGDVPMAEMLVGRNKVLIEGYTLEDSDAVVVIVLSARERNFDEVLASVHEQVLFNDGVILTGSDVAETAGDGEPTDLTDDGETEEPTEEAATLPTEDTEEATSEVVQDEPTEEAVEDEPTEEAIGEEDDATEEPVDERASDDEPVESSVEGGVFTSQLYDYAFEFDEDIWTVGDEFRTEGTDGVLLTNDLGSLTVWSWDAYGADAASCLAGEADYYASEDSSVSDWMPAEDAKGDPIEGDGEGFAWGVYRLVYTNADGDEVDLVDYIECREIPGDDAVVIIFASASPDDYNEHLEQVLEVADSIEIEGEVSDPGTSDIPEEPEEIESGLSGSLFTSPAYGFTIDIPSQWRIESERLTADNEELVLSNGVSDITLWATSDYQGDLAGCVDFAAEESGLDLELDTNAEGEPFRGEGRREAYGNFRYTDDNGDEMMYFVACQDIVEGESVLILTQDVPYDQFASQRKFRAELEDSIVIP